MLPCRYGVNCTRQATCSFAHDIRESIPCKFGAACTKASCVYSHPDDNSCPYGNQCTNADCTLLHPEAEICYDEHCVDPNCMLQHVASSQYQDYNNLQYYDRSNSRHNPAPEAYPNQYVAEKEVRLCRFGDQCTNTACPFSHPMDNWVSEPKLCRYGERCNDPKCQFTHASPISQPVEVSRGILQPLPPKSKECLYGAACTDPHCTLLHLSDDPLPMCPNGDACSDPNCAEAHPEGMDMMACAEGAKCADPTCMFFHPKSRYEGLDMYQYIPPPAEMKQCRWGANCSDPRCPFSHVPKPKTAKLCRYGAQCTDPKCAFLHPDEKDESIKPVPRHNRYVATLEFIFKDSNLACDMRLRRLIERGFGGQPGDLDDDTTEPDDEVHWKVDANTNTIRNNWREGGWVYLPALLEWHPDTQNLDMDIRAVAAKLKHKPDATIEVSADLEWIRRKGNKILPPKRPWVWRTGYEVEDGFMAFTVASWNLQADMTRTNSDGTNRSLLALGKRQILQGLGMPPQLRSPSICCLQELQTMGFTAEAGPGSKYDHASGMVKLLEAQGYGGRLYPSMKNTIGIFWKNSEFTLEEEHILSYSISYKGAIFVLLRHLATRRRLMVATTHLSVPIDKYSKFIGFKPLLEITECLKEILALRKQWADEHGPPPLVLAGDFNSEPDSSVYQLLTKGAIQEGNVDIQAAEHYGLKVDLPLVYPPLRLSSVMQDVLGKEPDYTNVNDEMEFVATLDYIMHTGLRVEGTLDVFPQQPVTLPNEQVPSDHIPLCALFSFLPSSVTPFRNSPHKEAKIPSAVAVASANKRTYTLPSPTQNIMRQRETAEQTILPVNLSNELATHSPPGTPRAHDTLTMPRSSSLGSIDGSLESPMGGRLSNRLQKLTHMTASEHQEVKIHTQDNDSQPQAGSSNSSAALETPPPRKLKGILDSPSSSYEDQPRLPASRSSGLKAAAEQERLANEMKQKKDRSKPVQRLVQLRPDGSPNSSPSKPRKDPPTEPVRILKAPSTPERMLGKPPSTPERIALGKSPSTPERIGVGRAPSTPERTVLGTMRTENDTHGASRQRPEEEEVGGDRGKTRRSSDEIDKREGGSREHPKIIVVDGQHKQERRESTRRDSSKDSRSTERKNSSSSPADNVRTLVVKPSSPTERPVLPRPASAQVDVVRVLKAERPVLPKPRSASTSPAMSALTPPFTSTAGGSPSRSWSPRLSSTLNASSPSFTSTLSSSPQMTTPIASVRTLKPQVTAK